ncbi:MAG: UDP-N-acetylglucosamine 2-epimerase (non-hydrolyzing) [Planctomycetota bacterium]
MRERRRALPQRVLLIFGTRPEAIKLAPVHAAFSKRPELFDVKVCVTAQHRELLDQVLEIFQIEPDVDLDLMQPGQRLVQLAAAALQGVDRAFDELEPGLVIVQGDTSTTLAAALSAFYREIPLAHVEAGLRTGQRHVPFPEEVNRRLTSVLADWHFAPTERARRALLEEGVPPERVFVTGNTVVDALHMTVARLETLRPLETLALPLDPSKHLLLLTTHRRESFDGGIEQICRAVAEIALRPDVEIVFPVHPNPNVRRPAGDLLEGLPGVHLTPPLGYPQFVALLARSHLVLTDSGGVQEEAPSLAKPVVVMRETTERPEVVEAGGAVLVGTDRQRIVAEVTALLDDPERYRQMAQARNPFGTGDAAERIAEILVRVLGLFPAKESPCWS